MARCCQVAIGPETPGQTVMAVNSVCLASHTRVSLHYWSSKTPTGGDADSAVVHFVADTG